MATAVWRRGPSDAAPSRRASCTRSTTADTLTVVLGAGFAAAGAMRRGSRQSLEEIVEEAKEEYWWR